MAQLVPLDVTIRDAKGNIRRGVPVSVYTWATRNDASPTEANVYDSDDDTTASVVDQPLKTDNRGRLTPMPWVQPGNIYAVNWRERGIGHNEPFFSGLLVGGGGGGGGPTGPAGGVLGGNFPNPGFAQDMATQAELDAESAARAGGDAARVPNALVDAKGDLLTASANDTPARLGVGADGQVLAADSTAALGIKWTAAPGGGILPTIVNAKGDLIGATADDTPARVPAAGVDGQFLKSDASQATGVTWAGVGEADIAALSADLSGRIPFAVADAKGDLLAADAADSFVRVGVGADGKVLVADSAAAAGVSWQTLVTGLVLSGTLAARPAASAGNSGQLYFATDDVGGTLYRSDGAAWTKVAASVLQSGGAEVGYAQLVSNFSATGVYPTRTDVTGLTITFTASGTKSYMLRFWGMLSNNNAAGISIVSIMEGATELGFARMDVSAANKRNAFTFELRVTPTAGAHTYKVATSVGTASSADIYAATSQPAYLQGREC